MIRTQTTCRPLIMALFALSLMDGEQVFITAQTNIFDIETLMTETNVILNGHLFDRELRNITNDAQKVKIKEYQRFLNDISQNSSQYASHPINEFLLVRRLAQWNEIQHLVDTSFQVPNQEDVSGAARDLLRLQMIYQLDTIKMANGELLLLGRSKSHENYQMNAGDCWEMGRQAYLVGEDDYAFAWMKEALHRHQTELTHPSVELSDVLQFYAFSSYKQGKYEMAAQLTEKLIELLPGGQAQLAEIYEETEQRRMNAIESTGQVDHDDTFKALCRGEKLMDQQLQDQLYCSYEASSIAFLRLQPIKRELVSLHPHVVIFHDIVSDQEIEMIKQQPTLQQARDNSSLNNVIRRQPYNITQQRRVGEASEFDSEHWILKKLSRRFQDIAGLKYSATTPATNIPWSVLTYKAGGHFSPHYDFLKGQNETEKGDILATFILYLNDVEAGGATVFPETKARVQPAKGSAAFWYNLHPNGEGNRKTLHASCPILSDFKQLAVKFFNTHEQEFRRPCHLNYNADEHMLL